jgi:hypothetical protein
MSTPTDNTAPLFLPSGVNDLKTKINTPRKPIEKLAQNGHWLFPEPMFQNKQVGFVYGIRNRHDGSLYIGKKLYAGTGKLNKGVESNWKYYTSSNKQIDSVISLLRNNDLSANSIFDFICLEEYCTKGTFSFAEVWCLVTAEVPCNRKIFYNRLINGVSWPCSEQLTSRMKTRLYQFIAGDI